MSTMGSIVDGKGRFCSGQAESTNCWSLGTSTHQQGHLSNTEKNDRKRFWIRLNGFITPFLRSHRKNQLHYFFVSYFLTKEMMNGATWDSRSFSHTREYSSQKIWLIDRSIWSKKYSVKCRLLLSLVKITVNFHPHPHVWAFPQLNKSSWTSWGHEYPFELDILFKWLDWESSQKLSICDSHRPNHFQTIISDLLLIS